MMEIGFSRKVGDDCIALLFLFFEVTLFVLKSF